MPKLIVVSGIATAPSRDRFGQLPCDSVLIVESPTARTDDLAMSAIDLTAYVGREAAVLIESQHLAPKRVLVRDHQLENDELVIALQRHNVSVIALNTEIDYDTDVSWIESRLDWAASRVTIEWFVLDVFCGVQDSWSELFSVRPDEFSPADLESLCMRFPILLSADVTLDNCLSVFSFPGSRGLLLTCDEVSPLLPPERHAVTAGTAYAVVTTLMAVSEY
ncbi:hypothetical protein [Polyangium spumosum]|uniref:Uncharacterized protein n=1 Tax=Polyangium spumosum TaxID=889282 RepID=A0A6N7PWK2_9BACT|nr:hypothetical protein [Polyangium spumosum]MRG96383.1 hypothetical protein [Polyangium spumosum]